MSGERWNRYFEIFAATRGRTAAAQDAIDRAKPTGKKVEFMLWIGEQKRAFRDAHPEAFLSNRDTIADHTAWAAWLEGALERLAAGAVSTLALLTLHRARTWL